MHLYSTCSLKIMKTLYLYCIRPVSCPLSSQVHTQGRCTDKNTGIAFNKKHVPETKHITGWQRDTSLCQTFTPKTALVIVMNVTKCTQST